MGKALQERIEALFDATKDLMTLEAIEPYCNDFNEWIKTQTYSEKSLGTLFSRYGLYSKFKTLKLVEGENAGKVETRDKDGNPKGYELKHYVPLLCGLNQAQWDKRNESSKVAERNANPTELDPDAYLKVTGILLASDDPHELAVGIIAATGRRPHEVIARAKFTPVEGKPYHVNFEGQGKKRGENPIFEIPTLYPADYIIKALARYRKIGDAKTLLKEVESIFPDNIPAQNQKIDSRRNGSLNRVVDGFFGAIDPNKAILKFRHGEESYSNRGLRAAYTALAIKRDCKGGTGEAILYASKILGHNSDDAKVKVSATTIAYTDFLVSKSVTFPKAPKREQVNQVRLTHSDAEVVKELQVNWKLPNQQSVISRLIERHELTVELGKQLQNFEQQVKALTEENQRLKEMIAQNAKVEPVTQTEDAENMDSLEAKIERIVEEKLTAILGKVTIPTSNAQPVQREVTTPDFTSMSNADLWNTKVKGASEEKVLRSFNAIRLYNDTLATGDNDRIAINNQTLRELSGVNGLIVGDWVKTHADEVISHNAKYGMQNSKDPQRTDTYYNKRHGGEKITGILQSINAKLLEGASPVG